MSTVKGAAAAPTLLKGWVNVGHVGHVGQVGQVGQVTAVAFGLVFCVVSWQASRSEVTA